MKNENPPRKSGKQVAQRKAKTRPAELPQILVNNRGTAYMNYRKRRFYLGRYSTPEEILAAERERLRIIAEHEAGLAGVSPARKTPVTVAMLVRSFLKWAKKKYVKHGRSTGSAERFGYSAQPLLDLYAALPVTEFRPLALKAVRQKMVEAGLCRKVVNQRIGFIRQIFKWGVGEELVPTEIKAALYDVPGLEAGETEAPERARIKSVDFETVMKTLPFCHPVLADMIQVQLYGGMRPQDVCNMQLCDIDRSGDVWIYAPWEHKTEHTMDEDESVVRWLGPQAQQILEPYVRAKESTPEAFLFSPADAYRLIQMEKRMARKSKVQPSQADRSVEHPMIKPGEKYKTGSYRTAIKRACRKGGIEEWSPNRLRHTWGTYIEKKYDKETARIILGHKSVNTTEIYLDRDRKKGIEVAREIG